MADKLACINHQSYFAGSGFTRGICKNCNAHILHSNTFIPKYCDKCSDNKKICRYCGQDLTTKL